VVGCHPFPKLGYRTAFGNFDLYLGSDCFGQTPVKQDFQQLTLGAILNEISLVEARVRVNSMDGCERDGPLNGERFAARMIHSTLDPFCEPMGKDSCPSGSRESFQQF
jgi:hypothetical protein